MNKQKSLTLLTIATLLFSIIFISILNISSGNIKASAAQDNLTKFETSTYLGSTGNDGVGGMGFSRDGNFLYVAINSTGNDYNLAPKIIDGGGDGMVLKMNRGGTVILDIARVSDFIDDLKVDPVSGNVVIIGDGGVKSIAGDFSGLIFKNDFGTGGSGIGTSGNLDRNGRRLSIGANGNIAALINKSFTIYQQNGTIIKSSQIGNTAVNTIAIDSGSETVFLGGYTQKDGGLCSKYKSPFVRAFDYNAVEKYKLYDWTQTEVSTANPINSVNNCADSEVKVLNIGKDGNLLMGAISDGGNNVFRHKPKDLRVPAVNPIISETPLADRGAERETHSGAGPQYFAACRVRCIERRAARRGRGHLRNHQQARPR